MLDAARAGRLKALWVIGYDVLLTNANAHDTARAFASMDFVVVQDLFMTETARRFGSVFLPACSSFEKDGTFMNAERRIQRVRHALQPAGSSKPDWRIICDLARAMGHPQGFEFADVQDIWNEVRAGCEGARGMTYERLDRAGLQWPCPSETHPARRSCTSIRSPPAARAPLRMVDYPTDPRAHDTQISLRADDGPFVVRIQRRDDDRTQPPARAAPDGSAGDLPCRRRHDGNSRWRPRPDREPVRQGGAARSREHGHPCGEALRDVSVSRNAAQRGHRPARRSHNRDAGYKVTAVRIQKEV